jgi:DNA invertase Pin-like site-specific DNA recombinase
MQDLGISALKGKNKKGALGQFLQLVKDGKIASGSVLIVENLDRLSREQPINALSQFINIIQAGIKLVTMQNDQEYTQKNLNEGQLYLTVGEIIRANRKSERKSFLVGNAWAIKQKNALEHGIIMTKRIPYWL